MLAVKEALKGKVDESVNIGGSGDASDTKVEAVKDVVASRPSLEKPSKVKCGECGSMCLKNNMKRHMRLLHGIKKMKVRPYICPEKGCGMSWAKIGLLKNHIKRCHAANDGNFENYNDSLQELDTMNTSEEAQHNLVHKNSDDKQGGDLNTTGFARNGKAALYHCNIEGCDRIYVNRQSLIRHNRIDHLSPTAQSDSAMLFKCKVPQCGAVFLKKGHLAEHSKRDHSKREHAKKEHSQEDTFPCGMPQCNLRFVNKGNLARHIREVHKGNRRSGKVGKKDEDTFVLEAEEINIDIEDVHADADNHEQGVGLDDDGTMEVVLDTTNLFEEGARGINSGEGNVECQGEVENNIDNMHEIKDNGEAATESFEMDPLRVGHKLEDEIY